VEPVEKNAVAASGAVGLGDEHFDGAIDIIHPKEPISQSRVFPRTSSREISPAKIDIVEADRAVAALVGRGEAADRAGVLP
jgi:hypothetical protein